MSVVKGAVPTSHSAGWEGIRGHDGCHGGGACGLVPYANETYEIVYGFVRCLQGQAVDGPAIADRGRPATSVTHPEDMPSITQLL